MPVFFVDCAVLKRFGDVGGGDLAFTGKVCDGPGDFDYPCICAVGKTHGLRGKVEHFFGVLIHRAESLDCLRRKARIALKG